jgi:2TM domain-containing protein
MASLRLESYKQAERKLAVQEERHGFAVHAVITAFVSVALIVVNVFVASEFPWAVFPVAGMSSGLFVHWYFGVARAEELMHRHQEEIEHRAG